MIASHILAIAASIIGAVLLVWLLTIITPNTHKSTLRLLKVASYVLLCLTILLVIFAAYQHLTEYLN